MRRPLRVLHVIYRADRAGAETWLVHLLRHIDRERTAIDFVVHDRAHGAHNGEIQELGARLFICDGHRNLWRHFRSFRRVIQRNGPYDAVHSHVDYFGGVIVLMGRLLGIRARIVNCHQEAPENKQSMTLARRVYIAAMKLLVRRFATAGLATSETSAAVLFGSEWRSDPRWQVHTACVDLQDFHGCPDRSAVRAELGIPEDSLVFGHVGRFVEAKNHQFIVRIAQVLAAKEPRAHFLFVGDGPNRRQTEDLIRQAGLSDRFTILPPRDDIPRLMKGAFDFFVFPSRSEGLGLALVEAQAAGLRCLVSSAVPPEAVVIPALVQRLPLPAGPECWAGAILRQLDTPNPVTHEEALRAVESVFDIRRNAEQLVEFYQAVTS